MRSAILLLTLLFWNGLSAQKVQLKKMGKLADGIDEASGIAMLSTNVYAQINDSGNPPCIFFTDSTGTIIELDCPAFLTNVDWEDLSYGDSTLFIGDFGNNANMRKDLKIYKLAINDTYDVSLKGVINFKYQRQKNFPALDTNKHFDVEAMLYYRDSLHLFTKNRTSNNSGVLYHYVVPTRSGSYILFPRDSTVVEPSTKMLRWATSADLNPSASRLALLGYKQLWLFDDFKGSNFLTGKRTTLYFNSLSQKEGLCFINDSTMLITDERHGLFPGGNIYKLTLKDDIIRNLTSEKFIEISPKKEIDDIIEIRFNAKVSSKVYWEMFNVKGERVLFGKFNPDEIDPSSNTVQVEVSTLKPGGYVLSIIMDKTTTAYKLKKLMR